MFHKKQKAFLVIYQKSLLSTKVFNDLGRSPGSRINKILRLPDKWHCKFSSVQWWARAYAYYCSDFPIIYNYL